ncbi:hypothetical protein VTH82DRAFT_1344 [Thermothelomyces myriococcoides]
MSRYEESSQTPESLLTPLLKWKGHIEKRMSLEEEMENKFRKLVTEYEEKCAELEREKANAMLWHKECQTTTRELNRLKAATDSAPFAFVLIDGDGAVFREELIALGEEGGGEAAHELHKQLKAYFRDDQSFSSIDTIFVHVVLNVEGLSRALHTSGVLSINDHTILTKFARGFCRSQPLFSFIDVGYGKEQADHKVRKLFEAMERNVQCKCLILAGSHDNGYATFLESFRDNKKIRLLETTPKAADFGKLPFSWVSFPSVFRKDPLPTRPSYAPASPPRNPIPMAFNSNNSTDNGPNNPPGDNSSPTGSPRLALSFPSYAAVGQGTASQVINLATQRKLAPPRPYYMLNKNNERVDPPIDRVDPQAKEALEERKKRNGGVNPCNKYHLLGNCNKGPSCNFFHGDRLPPAEVLALRQKVRGLACSAGRQCRDASCFYGHHCVSPGPCSFRDRCHFADTHGMDTTPTMKVYDDNTREIIG